MSAAKSKRIVSHYETNWLPPFSLASLVGIALFVSFVGSALWKTIPFKSDLYGTGVGALYTTEDEKELCSRQLPQVDTCFAAERPTNRTLYLQPYGGLGNRLRATASAFSLAREVDANVVIVWTEKEHGFRGAWNDLFESPRLPLGCFPGDVVREERAACHVHRINHFSEWESVKNKFERHGEEEVLCLQSMMFLTYKQRGLKWFFKLLRPAAPIMQAITHFQNSVDWNAWGYWIGVHVRRTDLRLKCKTDLCLEGIKVADALPLQNYTQLVAQITSMPSLERPRVFLATDVTATEAELRASLEDTVGLTGETGQVVSFSKAVRDAAKDSLEMRSQLAGLQEAVIDMWLLSRCNVLVGTEGSTYSQAARLIGDPFFTTVGVAYENKM